MSSRLTRITGSIAVGLLFDLVGLYANSSGSIDTITELTMSASDVAVVEIIRRTPVEFEYRSEKRICGYRVEARVIESFKGDDQWIEFVDPMDGDPRETKNRYIVFVFSQLNEAREQEAAASFYEAESRCFISASRKLIRAQPRTILRLVAGSAAEGGWAVVQDDHIDVARFRRKSAEEDQLVSWEDVRGEIKRTLEAMRRAEGEQGRPPGSSE